MTQHKDLQLAADLRNVVTRLVKKMRKESATGQQLSMTERSTLALLQQHKELLPSELASMEHITNQSMSQIVSHLLELGLISRTASVTDKRKVIIALTAEGEKTIMRVRSEREEWLAKAINESCTDEEAAILKHAITALTKLVEFE